MAMPPMSQCAVFLALALAGCGGTQVAPKIESEPSAPSPVAEGHGSKLQMGTELGEIDPKDTTKTFDKLKPAFMECHKEGLQRIEYLEGEVKFFVRVGQDGRVRWTYLEDSSLGDFVTEQCMLDAITSSAWPKPRGGDAEVRSSIGFDSPNARPPAPWGSEKVADAVARGAARATKCKAGAGGKFHVTLYVQPHGKTGKVQAVGVSTGGKDGAPSTGCIANEILGWTMPSPGSWAAKVSFDL